MQSRVKKRKAGELLAHLQQLLRDPASEAATCLETLDYFLARYLHVHSLILQMLQSKVDICSICNLNNFLFLTRLSSENSPSRLQALAGLRLILTPSTDTRMDTGGQESESCRGGNNIL